jgi:hypothetical protein
MRDLMAAFNRSQDSLLADAAGLLSLIAMLVAGLNLTPLL